MNFFTDDRTLEALRSEMHHGIDAGHETGRSIIGGFFGFILLGLSLTGWFLVVVLYAAFWIGVFKLALWLFF